MDFVAILNVKVDLNGVPKHEIKAAIEHGISEMFGNGAVTGESEAEVVGWDLQVLEVVGVHRVPDESR